MYTWIFTVLFTLSSSFFFVPFCNFLYLLIPPSPPLRDWSNFQNTHTPASSLLPLSCIFILFFKIVLIYQPFLLSYTRILFSLSLTDHSHKLDGNFACMISGGGGAAERSGNREQQEAGKTCRGQVGSWRTHWIVSPRRLDVLT